MDMNGLVGKRVFVYWDLHRKCFSLRSMETGRVLNYEPNPEGGRRKVPVNEILLTGCEFRVNPKGRQKVLDTGVKNVHAGVVGTVAATSLSPSDFAGRRQVKYNPEWYSTFVDAETEAPVFKADSVVMNHRRVYAGGR